MDKQALWDQACQLMHAEMTEVTFNTWIRSALRPLGELDPKIAAAFVQNALRAFEKQE